MKQFFSIGAIIMSLMVVALQGCAQKTPLVMTKEGVDCLKFGMKFDKIPPSCEGFYDRIERKIEGVEGGDAEFLYFYLGNELVTETSRPWGETGIIYDHTDDVLTTITIYSSKVSTPEGVYPGMPIQKLLMVKGVEGTCPDEIEWTYSLGISGYQIYYDESDLTDQGKEYINKNCYNEPFNLNFKLSNAHFKPNAKVRSITLYKQE